MMKPHNVGGALSNPKIKTCYAWVWLTDEHGVFIQISKTEAREVVNAAKEDGLVEIMAFIDGDELFLGDEPDADEGAEEGEEEDLGEEEEEADEEEADEEEEEAPAAKPAAEAKRRK